jgi:hypothetical protein
MTDQTEIYVYETPDGGDTIYRRKIGSDSRELYSTSEKKKNLIDDLREQKLWGEIRRAAEDDPVLQEMLDRIVVYHRLRNSP